MLTDDRIAPLLSLVEQHYGLTAAPLAETLRTAILELARTRGVDAGQLATELASAPDDDAGAVELVSRLLLGHTHFYRHARVWEWLEANLQRTVERGPVRALVAGCSTGEEAYTMACLLASLYGLNNIEVVAVDVSPASLDRGRHGTYAARDTTKLPDGWQERFVEPAADGTVRFHAALRTRIRFAWCNITRGLPEGPFHIVTVRNVLTYMTHAASQAVLKQIRRVLARPGLLVVAPHESFLVSEVSGLPAVVDALPIFSKGTVVARSTETHFAAASPRAPEPVAEAVAEPDAASEALQEPGDTGDRLVAEDERLHVRSPGWLSLLDRLRVQMRARPERLTIDLSVVYRMDDQVQQSLKAAIRLLEAAGTDVAIEGPLAKRIRD